MDARIRYTKMVIKDAFIALLQETSISKITVKAICEKAMINRATFYKYYDNPFDLMKKMETELMDHLQDEIVSLEKPDLPKIFQLILCDIKEQKELYLTLFSENGDNLFKERIFSLCYQENIQTIRRLFPDWDVTKQEWLYYFIAEGCNGILNQWIIHDMQESPEVVVEFVKDLIASINRIPQQRKHS